MPFQFLEFLSSQDLFETIISHIKNSLSSQNYLTIGLSGGNSPRPLYELISRTNLDFERVGFYQVDERLVPSSDQDSNQKMILKAFGGNPEILNSFTPYNVDSELNTNQILTQYNQKLPDSGLDICLLGVGTDGHFGSIFPAISADEKIIFDNDSESNSKTLHTISKPPYPVPDRLTLSPQYILASQKIIIILIGEDKKPILEIIKSNSFEPNEFPVNLLNVSKNIEIYYCLG
jgi:6-phosphogluconolactonase